jgi:hypothetical protein
MRWGEHSASRGSADCMKKRASFHESLPSHKEEERPQGRANSAAPAALQEGMAGPLRLPRRCGAAR